MTLEIKRMPMSGPFLVWDRHDRAPRRATPTAGHRIRGIFDRARGAFGRTLKASVDIFAEAGRKSRQFDELATMSDLELADIGINRADIPAVVAGVHRGRRPVLGAAATIRAITQARRP